MTDMRVVAIGLGVGVAAVAACNGMDDRTNACIDPLSMRGAWEGHDERGVWWGFDLIERPTPGVGFGLTGTYGTDAYSYFAIATKTDDITLHTITGFHVHPRTT